VLSLESIGETVGLNVLPSEVGVSVFFVGDEVGSPSEGTGVGWIVESVFEGCGVGCGVGCRVGCGVGCGVG